MPSWPQEVRPINASQLPLILLRPKVIAVHCWASWNGHDCELARQLAHSVKRFKDTVDFYQMDIEDPINVDLIASWDIRNVPAFVVYRNSSLITALWQQLETIDQFLKRVEAILAKSITIPDP